MGAPETDAERLEQAISASQKSKREIATECELDTGYLYRILRGDVRIGRDLAPKLAKATGVSAAYLVGWESSREANEVTEGQIVAELHRRMDAVGPGFRDAILMLVAMGEDLPSVARLVEDFAELVGQSHPTGRALLRARGAKDERAATKSSSSAKRRPAPAPKRRTKKRSAAGTRQR